MNGNVRGRTWYLTKKGEDSQQQGGEVSRGEGRAVSTMTDRGDTTRSEESGITTRAGSRQQTAAATGTGNSGETSKATNGDGKPRAAAATGKSDRTAAAAAPATKGSAKQREAAAKKKKKRDEEQRAAAAKKKKIEEEQRAAVAKKKKIEEEQRAAAAKKMKSDEDEVLGNDEDSEEDTMKAKREAPPGPAMGTKGKPPGGPARKQHQPKMKLGRGECRERKPLKLPPRPPGLGRSRPEVPIHKPIPAAQGTTGGAKPRKVLTVPKRGPANHGRGSGSGLGSDRGADVVAQAKDAADGEDTDDRESQGGVEDEAGGVRGLESDDDDDDLPVDAHESLGKRSDERGVRRVGRKRRSDVDVAELEAKVEQYVKHVNLLKSMNAALKKDKKYLEANVDSTTERLKRSEEEKETMRIEVIGLKAELEAADETNPNISATGSKQGGPTPVKRSKKARVDSLAAMERERLPKFQQCVLDIFKDKELAVKFCKAVVRQCDPEDFVLNGKGTYKWLPPPRKLCDEDAAQVGCNTAGRGCLEPGDGEGNEVVQPPMLVWKQPAMFGGLFGVYPGRKKDWTSILVRIVSQKSSGLVKWSDFPSMTAEEIEKHCESICQTSAAICPTQTLVSRGIDNQTSYRKTNSVKEYMSRMGYKWDAKDRYHAQEVAEVMRKTVQVGWSQDDWERDPKTAVLVDGLRKKGALEPQDLRRWRMNDMDDLCADDCPQSKLVKYKRKGMVDVLFKNFPARCAYTKWAGLPSRGRKNLTIGDNMKSLPEFTGDASILTLARLDAWMSAQIILAMRPVPVAVKSDEATDEDCGEDGPKEDGAKGGGFSQNHDHNLMYEMLLPRAIEGVLDQIRDAVSKVRPDELYMPFDYDEAAALGDDPEPEAMDATPSCRATVWGTGTSEGHEGDLHGQGWREVTSSHYSPFDKMHYVVALPSFISCHVCSWIGEVRDGFVGVNDGSQVLYEPITAPPESYLPAS